MSHAPTEHLFIAENLHPLKKKRKKEKRRSPKLLEVFRTLQCPTTRTSVRAPKCPRPRGRLDLRLNLTLPHFRSNATLPCLHKRRTLHNQYDETQRNPLQSTDTVREPQASAAAGGDLGGEAPFRQPGRGGVSTGVIDKKVKKKKKKKKPKRLNQNRREENLNAHN